MHIEEDVSTAIAVSLDSGFLRARNVQVVVRQPRLLLHVEHITDVMTYGLKTIQDVKVKVAEIKWFSVRLEGLV